MENDTRKRIKSVLAEKHISINSLIKGNAADGMRLSRQLKEDGASIAHSTISLILETFPDISADWLLRGVGEMSIDRSTESYNDRELINHIAVSTITERIKAFVKNKDISINALSRVVGLPQTTINEYFAKGKKPSFSIIYGILTNFPDISAEWLLRGKGDMYIGKNEEPTTLTNENELRERIEELKDRVQEQKETIADLRERVQELKRGNTTAKGTTANPA